MNWPLWLWAERIGISSTPPSPSALLGAKVVAARAVEQRAEHDYATEHPLRRYLVAVQEAAEDEEQYWDTHPYSRFKRNAKAYIDSKFRKDQASTLLGASRLTQEEQEELNFEEVVPDDDDSDEDNDADDDGDDDDDDNANSSVVSGLTKDP